MQSSEHLKPVIEQQQLFAQQHKNVGDHLEQRPAHF